MTAADATEIVAAYRLESGFTSDAGLQGPARSSEIVRFYTERLVRRGSRLPARGLLLEVQRALASPASAAKRGMDLLPREPLLARVALDCGRSSAWNRRELAGYWCLRFSLIRSWRRVCSSGLLRLKIEKLVKYSKH